MQIGVRQEAVASLCAVAACIAVVFGRMERLVQIADEVDEEGERDQPVTWGKLAVGDDSLRARDLDRYARALPAIGLDVERLADVGILIMPGSHIAESVAERLDAIGPDRGLLDRA